MTDPHDDASVSAPFVTRLRLRNFKSIGWCDVHLRPLTFLVGRNGSGKSNFMDALRLVADALRTSLDHALRERGGINEVRRRSTGHPTHFHIALDLALPDGLSATYAFKVGARRSGTSDDHGWEVTEERCSVSAPFQSERSFVVKAGEIVSTTEQVLPPAAADRLLLVAAAGLPAFKPVFDGLSRMGFYNLNPEQIRELQPPDAGDLLLRDGRNLPSVLGALERRAPEAKARIVEYLAKVVPGVVDVRKRALGPRETLEFRQQVAGASAPWTFLAANMSDGTLRTLGILVALFQTSGSLEQRVPLVGIEEPEVALHPAAAGALLGCLQEASEHTQVVVTSHSADLLDDDSLPAESILAVSAAGGVTHIGQVDEAGRSAIRDHLFTVGELLRQDQLVPEGASEAVQHELFDEGA